MHCLDYAHRNMGSKEKQKTSQLGVELPFPDNFLAAQHNISKIFQLE